MIATYAWLAGGEIPSQRLRSYTFGLAAAVGFFFAWLTTFTAPYFINPDSLNWGPRYGYIWFPSCVVGALWVYFFLPEVKGRTLEEIDEMVRHVATGIILGNLLGNSLLTIFFAFSSPQSSGLGNSESINALAGQHSMRRLQQTPGRTRRYDILIYLTLMVWDVTNYPLQGEGVATVEEASEEKSTEEAAAASATK